MSTLGDAADVNPVIKFLPHTCNAHLTKFLGIKSNSINTPLTNNYSLKLH